MRMHVCRANGRAMVCVGPGGELPIDLDAAAAESHEFLNTRTSERKEMIILNDRLAVYIDKVTAFKLPGFYFYHEGHMISPSS